MGIGMCEYVNGFYLGLRLVRSTSQLANLIVCKSLDAVHLTSCAWHVPGSAFFKRLVRED